LFVGKLCEDILFKATYHNAIVDNVVELATILTAVIL